MHRAHAHTRSPCTCSVLDHGMCMCTVHEQSVVVLPTWTWAWTCTYTVCLDPLWLTVTPTRSGDSVCSRRSTPRSTRASPAPRPSEPSAPRRACRRRHGPLDLSALHPLALTRTRTLTLGRAESPPRRLCACDLCAGGGEPLAWLGLG